MSPFKQPESFLFSLYIFIYLDMSFGLTPHLHVSFAQANTLTQYLKFEMFYISCFAILCLQYYFIFLYLKDRGWNYSSLYDVLNIIS